jgi:hypothetical protein
MRIRSAYLTLPALAIAAAVAPGAPAAVPVSSVHVTDCQTGSDAAHRLATYHAQMQAVSGTARMSMRFQLIQRVPGASPRQVADSGLGAWHRSRSGVKKFGYSQTVKGLEAGVLYRSAVQFRWFDSSGRVIRRAKVMSGSCSEHGDLPNLTVKAVKIAPGASAGTAVYSVAVGNTGKAVAKGFSVALILDGALSDSTTVDQLDAGETKTVKLNGPVCHRLRAVVDREGAVTESVEGDNSLRSRC